MKLKLISVLLVSVFATAVLAEERVAKIPEADLDRLMGAVKPGAQESPWREIDWITNITQARRRAVAENKPLVIFTAADGSPLGRT